MPAENYLLFISINGGRSPPCSNPINIMPIEFRCTKCNKLLRTADDTAGKHAKCPECSEVLVIPAAGMTPPPPAAGGFPPPPPPSGPAGGSPFGAEPQPQYQYEPDSGNPYQSPSPFAPMQTPLAPPGEIRPTIVDLGDVMSRTWELYKQEWGMCLVVILVVMGCNFGVGIVSGIANNIIVAVTRDQGITAIFSMFTNLVSQVFSVWITIGQTRYFLKVARGQPAEIGEIFSGGPWLLPIIGAGILFGLMVFGGTLLLIVPGIILALMFSQFYYLIIDRNLGVMDSLSKAKEITNGNKMTLFLMHLVCMGLSIAGLLAFCVGIFAVIPYITLLQVMVYLSMTGQATIDQVRMNSPMR
jgi:hypothetical protein